MDENELLAKILPSLPQTDAVKVGPGDDCAVVSSPSSSSDTVLKTDAVVRGIHFTEETPAESVGRKALARCLSDFAAMGATPEHALITIGLPENTTDEWITLLYDGINTLAKEHGVSITGGETTSTSVDLFVSVAMTGVVEKDSFVSRSGAQPGDAIFVSGDLGGSIEGRHLTFDPRLKEGKWLAENFDIHAMMDLSDGLATDLPRLLECSKVGAEIHATSIPVHRDAKIRNRDGKSSKPPRAAALTDGEDYELLIVLPASKAVELLDSWRQTFPETNLSCIGKILDTPGLLIRDENGIKALNAHGYVHFKES